MKYLIFGLFMLLISFLTLIGDLQKVIHFVDPLNELFFCVITGTGGLIFMLGGVIKTKNVQQ